MIHTENTAEETKVYFWSDETLNLVCCETYAWFQSLGFNPNNSSIVIPLGLNASLINIANGQVERKLVWDNSKLGHISHAAFSPDGEHVILVGASESNNYNLRIVPADYRTLIADACKHLPRDLTSNERTEYFLNSSATCPQLAERLDLELPLPPTPVPTQTGLPTAYPSPTNTPTRVVTSTPNPTSVLDPTLLVQWKNGVLSHYPERNAIQLARTDIPIRDFTAEVTFYNPYAADEIGWDYGFFFRDTGSAQYRLIVGHDKHWELSLHKRTEAPITVNSGSIEWMHVNPSENNTVSLTVIGDEMVFSVNDRLVGILDVSAHQEVGTVSLSTGAFFNNLRPNAETRYTDFTLRQESSTRAFHLPTSAATNGKLEHNLEGGGIPTDWFDVTVQDFTLETHFKNPFAASIGSWDYGLFFRYSSEGHYRLVILSNGKWELTLHRSDGVIVVADGDVPTLNVASNESNQLRLAVNGEQAHFWINEENIGTLDVSDHIKLGKVGLGTGFFAGNQREDATTEYDNLVFTVLLEKVPPTPLAHIDAIPATIETNGSEQVIWSEVSLSNFVADINFSIVEPRQWVNDLYFLANESGEYHLRFNAEGSWFLELRDLSSLTQVTSGLIHNFYTDVGVSNHVRLIVSNQQGTLFVNDEYIDTFHLSKRELGDIGVVTTDRVINEVKIWSIDQQISPTSTPSVTRIAVQGENRGEINSGGGEIWEFVAEKGQSIDIKVEFENSAPIVLIYTPDGNLVDRIENYNVSRDDFFIEQDGVYQFRVHARYSTSIPESYVPTISASQ